MVQRQAQQEAKHAIAPQLAAVLGEKMQPKKRRFQIRQRQLRRIKNIALKTFSVEEEKRISASEREVLSGKWIETGSTMEKIESFHGIKFASLFEELGKRFPGETITVIDEGCGPSTLKQGLLAIFGEKIKVITTDIRKGNNWPDERINVMQLSKLGRNSTHLIISTYGGIVYPGLDEKALYQIVTALKPGGIGVVTTNLSSSKNLPRLAKRLNITIRQIKGHSISFTKNTTRKK